MNNVSNQNRKVLEGERQDFNSDAVKTTLRGLRYFKITSLFADSWKTSPSCSVALSPLIESILSGSVG